MESCEDTVSVKLRCINLKLELLLLLLLLNARGLKGCGNTVTKLVLHDDN